MNNNFYKKNKDKKPLVSVITACLNSEKYLKRAIESLLIQDYSNIEHIIIDGGSRDGTLDVIKKHGTHISYWTSEPDKGIYDAMNKGIDASKGDILYFLNSDDRLYDKDVIKNAVYFLNSKKADFAYGNILNRSLNDKSLLLGKYPNFITKRHFLRGTIGHPATFFRRDCFKKVGKFDIRYTILSDYEWFLRALFKYNLRSYHMKQVVSVFQCNGTSSDEKSRNCIASERKSIEKIYFSRFEILLGKFINFFLYGDFLRYILRFILRKKIYSALSDFKNKVYLLK